MRAHIGGMVLGPPLPGLTPVLSDRRSGLVIVRPLQPSQLVVAGFGGGGRSCPGLSSNSGFDRWTAPPSCHPLAHSLPR
jgi:hypothetical protein